MNETSAWKLNTAAMARAEKTIKDLACAESDTPAKHPDTERLEAIERMILAGRFNETTGRTELTAINCYLIRRDGLSAVVDLAIKEGRDAAHKETQT